MIVTFITHKFDQAVFFEEKFDADQHWGFKVNTGTARTKLVCMTKEM